MDVKNNHGLDSSVRFPIFFIRRTDGSNREYEAASVRGNGDQLTVWVSAVFAVGEVVELAPVARDENLYRFRARVMYRNSDQYGLYLLMSDEQAALPEKRSA